MDFNDYIGRNRPFWEVEANVNREEAPPTVTVNGEVEDIIYPYGSDSTKTIDITRFEACLKRADIGAILNDPVLFLAAFCKSLPQSAFRMGLTISQIGNKIIMKGDGTLNYLPLSIEKLRPFFLEGFEAHQNFEIYYLKDFNWDYLMKPAESFDFTIDVNGRINCSDKFIKPSLSALSDLLGAEYSASSKTVSVKTCKYSPAKLEKVEIIQIRWKNDINAAYQVLPRMIPKPKDLRQILYSDCLFGKNCDYRLIANNGVAIGVHSLMLRTYADDVFEKLISSGMIESQEKTIGLSDFSETTIRAFIDFVYLGGPEFQEKLMSSKLIDLDIWDLLELAYRFQVNTLVDCCTNLLSRFATVDDAYSLLKAAKLYNNEHLKELYNELVMSDVD